MSEFANKFDIARRGIELVANEVRRRGGMAAPDATPGLRNRLLIRSAKGTPLSLYVKTKRRGDWQTDTRKGEATSKDDAETLFWVFVDLGADQPSFFIAPGCGG